MVGDVVMTQLSDESGRPIGCFLTLAEANRFQQLEQEYRRLVYGWARTAFPEAELAKAERETTELATEEILRELERS